MSTIVNTKYTILSFDFTKQITTANINITPTFFKEIKHHWDSILVFEILHEKLHCVGVSNVNAVVKVIWLKIWNSNRFDKDALHFLKLPQSDFALDD